jgi:hypothetical protein
MDCTLSIVTACQDLIIGSPVHCRDCHDLLFELPRQSPITQLLVIAAELIDLNLTSLLHRDGDVLAIRGETVTDHLRIRGFGSVPSFV